MKRSLAPSALFMNKLRKLNDDGNSSSITSSVASMPIPTDGVNHLELYTMKPKHTSTEDDEEEVPEETTDKNFIVHKGGTPVCFGVKYENLNKDQKNYMQGQGT